MKFDKMSSSEIFNVLFGRFVDLPMSIEMHAVVMDEYQELEAEYPMSSEQDLVSILVRDCPEIYTSVHQFVESVFDETESFRIKSRDHIKSDC